MKIFINTPVTLLFMLDINLIREHADIVKKDLQKRNMPDRIKILEEIKQKDAEWKMQQGQIGELRFQRNTVSQQIADAKKNGKDAAQLVKQASEIPKELQKKEDWANVLKKEIDERLMQFPNILHETVPVGAGEAQNKEVKKFGAKPAFTFQPIDHVDLMEKLDLVDLPRAAKISGARFWFLKGDLAKLDLALQMYAVDFMTSKGYELIQPPYMMSRTAYEGVTDLKDFENVMYKIENEDLYLIATSEHPLTARFMNEIFPLGRLPAKFCGISACFRKEAGAHGKDTKGIFRGHQFNKVEQIIICKPAESWKLHEELVKNAIEFFSSLGLHFRQVNICTGDIGTVAAKKYDIEAWFPAQGAYREVASISNCTDYQARRLKIKYRTDPHNQEAKETAHTLNGTCVATSRALAAILENFQNKDGSVTIPKALVKYFGKTKITANVAGEEKKDEKKQDKKKETKKKKR